MKEAVLSDYNKVPGSTYLSDAMFGHRPGCRVFLGGNGLYADGHARWFPYDRCVEIYPNGHYSPPPD